ERDPVGGRRAGSILAETRRVDDERARWSRGDQIVPGARAEVADDRPARQTDELSQGRLVALGADVPKRSSRAAQVVGERHGGAAGAEADHVALALGPD